MPLFGTGVTEMDPACTTNAFWQWGLAGLLIPVCGAVFRIVMPFLMSERTFVLCLIIATLLWFVIMLFIFLDSLTGLISLRYHIRKSSKASQRAMTNGGTMVAKTMPFAE